MPKWTEYTSKDTLADNDEVMLYDATAKANKRGLMSKFWDYVVDKMATAVISKLETDNKTIIGAINALYGKTLPANVRLNYYNSDKEQYQLSFAFTSDTMYLFIEKNKIRANIKNKDTGWGKEITLVNFSS